MTMVRVSSRVTALLLLACVAIPVYLIAAHSDVHSTFFTSGEAVDDESYGIIMDAGSTGTRMFLYVWTAASESKLIDIRPVKDSKGEPVVKKVFPGLSTFASHPSDAAEYLKPLLDYAVEFVPEQKRPYTPIFIFATAGMRLVPEEQRKAILHDLHTDLPSMTVMQVMSEHIRVIEGNWEGIYSWIAVNYILGRFQPNNDLTYGSNIPTRRPNTVGMIDMGGASVQIAFEMPQSSNFLSQHVETINLGCHDESDAFKYKLFVTTFLGYGVNEGQRKYEQTRFQSLIGTNNTVIRDECQPLGFNKLVKSDAGTQYMRKGIGDWDGCVKRLSELIDPGSIDTCRPECFFGNVSAPEINLSEMQIFGFSEYWYSTQDVLKLGGKYNYHTIAEKSKQFCSQKWSQIQAAKRRDVYRGVDDARLETQCFKSAWVAAALHYGFDVDKDSNRFQSALMIEEQEVQWALGAMIYNMRYFPLRNSGAKVISKANVPASLGFWRWLPELLFVLASILALVYFFVVWSARPASPRLSPRRNDFWWGYKRLPQADFSSLKHSLSFA